jgi:hypothetical protein
MSSWLGQFHKFTKKYDPLGHALVNLAHKSSTKTVNETSRGLSKAGDAVGISTKFPDYWKDQSQKDKDSFNRWGENTLGAAALIYGGMSALSGAGGGSSGAAAGGSSGAGTAGVTGSGGAFLGEGVASGVPAWDGAMSAAGSGGFNSGLAQMGARGLGNKSTQGSDAGAIQRQLALAEMMRRHREDQDTAGALPGWVEMA